MTGRRDVEYRRDALAAAEQSHFWFVGRAALLGWALRRYFPDSHKILEVGCGTGSVTGAIRRTFPNATIVAGDADSSGLGYARARTAGVRFLRMDAARLPFGAAFDVGCAFDVIEHLDEDGEALAAIRAVVRPGGGVLITVPQHQWLWSAIDDFSHHRRRYSRAELRSKLEGAGLEIVRMTSFMTAVLPIMLWSRRKKSRTLDPERELRIPAAVNAILGAALWIERTLIALGASMPVGGSLLAVARRPA